MNKVSVILVTRDQAAHLEDCITSVLTQTFADLELLVVDRASSDATPAILAGQSDPRLRHWRVEADVGPGQARALACAQAGGEFVAIAHADCHFEATKLAEQIAVLAQWPQIGAVFALSTQDAAQAPCDRYGWLRRLFEDPEALRTPSVLIRRSLLAGLPNHDRLLELADSEAWVRLLMDHEIHVIPKALVRLTGTRPERSAAVRRNWEVRKVLRHYANLNADTYEKVFGERPVGDPRVALARRALLVPSRPWQAFALDLWYDALGNTPAEQWGEFLEATGRVDVFGQSEMPVPAPASAPVLAPVRPPTAVLLHLHYPELWPEFASAIRRIGPCDVYVSLTDRARDVAPRIAEDFPGALVLPVDNRGRDIAPRIELARRVRNKGYTQLLLLHGKRSPHLKDVAQINVPFLQHRDGDRWRRELVDALVEQAPRVISTFEQNPRVGLIGPSGFWLGLRGDANLDRTMALAQRMGQPIDPARHGYFAGSMFWCRPQALEPLLALNFGPQDFEPESGQTDATLAHACERAFALSVERAGFQIADTAGTLLAQPAKAPTPWMIEARCLPAERAWAQEFPFAASASVRVALAVAPNPALSNDSTLASLSDQWLAAEAVELPGTALASGLLLEANRALLATGGTWLGLLDAGDRLAPDAVFRMRHAIELHPEWQLLYTDEDNLTADGQHVNPHCKPDFNLDYLRSLPYIGGLLLIRRDLFETLGGFDPDAEGAEDYDLLLRAWEHLQASGDGERAIGHIPEVLYHRRVGASHTRKSVPELLAVTQQVLQAHFQRLAIAAEVQPGPFPPAMRVRWPLPPDRPMVSILIPTRDQLGMLQRCVESVIEKTRYPAYEILIIDNDSQSDDAVRYLDAIESREQELGGRLRVIRAPGPFNFSAMNNLAARAARGDYLLLLNNDTAALHEEWLDEMMGHAVRPDVGVVGAKLLYPDGKIQHAGVILGVRGPAEHPFIGRAGEDRGYFGRAQLVQDLSAVTGACLLLRKGLYEQLGGLDEKAFKVSYNDIDLCLRVRAAGLRVVFTPNALLLHEGSASQKGQVEQKPDEAKQKRFAAEREAMYDKWLPLLARDPAYNRHLSLATTEFQLDDQAPLAWDPEWRPRPRILVHPADREGCGEYRIIAPMRALNRAGMTQGWETMRLFQPAEMQRIDADSLVVQRQMEWPQIEALERNARLMRAFRVFEIDDLITNLPVKSVHRAHIHKDIAKRFRKAAGLCHRLVVATEPLAKAYAGFSDEVVVCPNYVERARWGELRPARAERKRLRVGWAGGVGHSGDLELIVDVVRQTAQQVDWVFFGLCPPALKDVVREFHPGVPLDQYAPKLAALDLDLAVAPLEHNAFNEAKSHLRLLEYGVLGYPVICSDITPYQGDFPVVRVANRFRDWVRAIQEAVSDPQALRAQGDALRAKVYENWMLEDHLDTWMRAWTR